MIRKYNSKKVSKQQKVSGTRKKTRSFSNVSKVSKTHKNSKISKKIKGGKNEEPPVEIEMQELEYLHQNKRDTTCSAIGNKIKVSNNRNLLINFCKEKLSEADKQIKKYVRKNDINGAKAWEYYKNQVIKILPHLNIIKKEYKTQNGNILTNKIYQGLNDKPVKYKTNWYVFNYNIIFEINNEIKKREKKKRKNINPSFGSSEWKNTRFAIVDLISKQQSNKNSNNKVNIINIEPEKGGYILFTENI